MQLVLLDAAFYFGHNGGDAKAVPMRIVALINDFMLRQMVFRRLAAAPESNRPREYGAC